MRNYFQIILLTLTALTSNTVIASDKNSGCEIVSLGINSSLGPLSVENSLKNLFSLPTPKTSKKAVLESSEFERLKELAQKGDVESQIQLAEKYENGDGITQSLLEAFFYYDLAAAQNDIRAFFSLGKMYYSGIGVAQNYYEAFKFLELAFKNGNALAASYLGEMYYLGRGICQNYEQARIHFDWMVQNKDLVNINHFTAGANYLGQMYYYGNGVSQNHKEAFRYFKLAAAHGHPLAQYQVGYMAVKKIDLGNNIEQREEDIKLGRDYLTDLADKGYLEAQKLVGEQYYFRKIGSLGSSIIGFPQDYKLAFYYYKLAADQHNDIDAKYNVGCMYVCRWNRYK